MDPTTIFLTESEFDVLHQSLHDRIDHGVSYSCGCCSQMFRLFCQLHAHLQLHPSGGSFHYDHVSRTAFPKYDTTCSFTQTIMGSDGTPTSRTFKQNYFAESAVNKIIKTGLDRHKNLFAEDTVDIESENDKHKIVFDGEKTKHLPITGETDAIPNGTAHSHPHKLTEIKSNDEHFQDGIDPVSVAEGFDGNGYKLHKDKNNEGEHKEKSVAAGSSSRMDDEHCFIQLAKTIETDISNRTRKAHAKMKSENGKEKDQQFVCNHKSCSKKTFASREKLRLHNAVHSGKNLYTCDVCNKQFVHKLALSIHLKNHSKKKFECGICEKVFSKKVLLTKHTFQHKDFSLECNVCKTLCETTALLTRHMLVHQDMPTKNVLTETKSFFCEICQKSFASKATLQFHKLTHAKVKPFSCAKCPKTFASKQGLAFHKNTHEGRKHVCKICGRKYGQEYTLRKHMVQHTADSGWNCEKCGKCFAIKSLLSKHEQCHNKEKRFTCEVCGFQTHSQNSIKMHGSTHGENRFKCADCDKTFSRKYAMIEHMHTHLGIKPFVCEFCAMSFTYQSSLVSHRRIHTGDKPYKCETCSRCFSLRHIYKRHLLTHTLERPFKCTKCDKAFTQEYNRTVHMRQHTGEKPFTCKICSRAFAQNCSLKSHMTTHDNL